MIHYIFFDLDGTLTDSKEGILKSVQYALEKLGRPVPPAAELTEFIGPPLQDSFVERSGLSPEEAQRAVALFRERYARVGKLENAAAPGMRELCRDLKARGYVLALASSKPEEMCRFVCGHFGFTPYLDVIVGSQPGADWQKRDVVEETVRRLAIPESDRSRILMVGDRRYDVEGAAACGISAAGVEFFGYAPPGELERAGAVTVARTAGELLAYILSH
jgi:phosphoglycolate phosphatase